MAKKETKAITIIAVSGNEDLLRRREVQKVIEFHRKHGWSIERADASKPGSLVNAMIRNDLFSEGSAQTLVHVEKPIKADLELLKDHLENGDGETKLLLEHEGKAKKNTIFGKWLYALGKNHRDFMKPKDYKAVDEAIPFLQAEAQNYGLTLSDSLAKSIVGKAGTDLGILSFEMLKISMLAEMDGTKEITQEQAKGAVVALKATPVSNILDALQIRHKALLARALASVFKSARSDPTMHVTRVIGPQAVSWLVVNELLGKGQSADTIAAKMGLNPWLLKSKVIPGIGRWKAPDLIRLIRGIAETERAILNGALSPWTILTVRLLESCG